MLQRGTTVKNRLNGLNGVVVGTLKGFSMIQCLNGQRFTFNPLDWQVIHDIGGAEELDSEISLVDQRHIDLFGVVVNETVTKIRMLENGLLAETNAKKMAQGELGIVVAERDAKLLTIDRLNRSLAEMDSQPEMSYRIILGEMTKAVIVDSILMSLEAVNKIASNLSKSIRRHIIVEHVRSGNVEFATLWRNGQQISA